MNGTRRSTRSTTDTAQQDENARPTRLTRARSAQPLVAAKTMQQSTVSVHVAGTAADKVTRKRAAMTDVSNRHNGVASQSSTVTAGTSKKAGIKQVVAVQRTKSEQPAQSSAVEKRKAARLTKQSTSTTSSSITEEEPPFKRGKSEGEPTPAVVQTSSTIAPAVLSELSENAATLTTRPRATSPQQEPVQLWDDLDAEDSDDPLMVSEYVNEIFEYLRVQEIKLMPNQLYMQKQDEINWKMRGILLDWLVEVHQKFRLLPETLFLAVNIVDRFLGLRMCSLQKLQLVGITALFVASKYEEVMCPSVQNFIYMADGGYTDDDVLKAEQYILQVLDFNLAYPNHMNFLRRISKADNYDIQVRTVAKYLLEVCMLDHTFMVYPPSLQSAAAMYLSRAMLGRGEWDHNLHHYSGYSEQEVMVCVHQLIDALRKPVKFEALFKKYASKKFIKASLYVRDWCKKQHNVDPIFDKGGDAKYLVENDYE
ncbi:cyclin-like protein [Protomyces lactucae-debilis]|uniref:Cyclin-like protein n=1 Tax=Protomyces lactucae-debilis TaxID=2754530 RepID=A0A1Y2F4E2_PROLT|nr:cyclin-like protein [Protomyces lactucae-debilis]ORY78196.1 cyclin-like protein [Protomyces lactucae-debilis]